LIGRREIISGNFIKGTRGFDLPFKKSPQTLPGSARHSSLTKRSQDKKAPISMIHADVYAQQTPTLYAQASFGKQ
jgi:hypothetical protein